MRKQRITVVLSVLMLLAGMILTGCGNKSANEAAKDKDLINLGVMLYNYTDIQGQEIKSYGSYLESNFNVKFNYATVGSSEEDHIKGLENLLASGVDGVISGYDTALEQSVSLAEEAGVYYAVVLGTVDGSVTSDYLVGGVKQFGDNPADLGALYAEQAYTAGARKVGVTSFPEFAFTDAPAIISGFTAKMQELDTKQEAEIYPTEYHSFAPDNASDAVTKIISEHPEVDTIFGLGSGMDFVYPAILNSSSPGTRLLALGYNNSTAAGLTNGNILMAGTNNYTQIMANAFAQLYDRINGHKYPDWQLNGRVNYVTLGSAEEAERFNTYVIPSDKGNGSVTADELRQVMISFNEQATWESLQQLTSRTLTEIEAARQE
ncbi:substrate-binding domain-containing protein [Paenibacillus sp. MMS20-IR301]|uniref:sugar ABC transporter substrate-binding protein n=1 Tax=Paenibacillus sp. MMS20-IR301 TaxID=2895946 RepID=UPI0028F07A87|nr:substrate-binding domain-containing protein [Paenibacillus sp. MMS20-IR301]WNS46675.1 substrate-binding domain-containing protein [Paenibacillus sp. MMS20-IR301]